MPAGARAGDRVELAIRPESIRLTAPASAGNGAVRVRIEEQSYLGNLNEYVVALGEFAAPRAGRSGR